MQRLLLLLSAVILIVMHLHWTAVETPRVAAQPRLADIDLDCLHPAHPSVCIEGIALVHPDGDSYVIDATYVYDDYPMKNMWRPSTDSTFTDPSIMVSFMEDEYIRPWGMINLLTSGITDTQYISVTMRTPGWDNFFPPLLAVTTVGDFTIRTAPKTVTMIAQPYAYYEPLLGVNTRIWSFNYFTDDGLLSYMNTACINVLKGATEADRQTIVLDGKSMRGEAPGIGEEPPPTVQNSSGQVTLGLSSNMLDNVDFSGYFPHDYLQSSACKWGADYEIPAADAAPIESDDFVAELEGVDLETTAMIYPDAVEVTVQNAPDGSSLFTRLQSTKAASKQLNLYTVKDQSLTSSFGSSDLYVGQTVKLPSKTDQNQSLSWTSGNANCTISKGTLAVVAVGECSVTATAPSKSRLKAFSKVYAFDALAKLSQTITATLPASIIGTNQTQIPSQTDALATLTWKIEKQSTKICSIKKAGNTTYLVGKATGTCAYRGSASGSVSHNAFLSDIYNTTIVAKTSQTLAAITNINVSQILNLPTQSNEGLTLTWKSKSKSCKIVTQKTPPLMKVQGMSIGACVLNASNRGNNTYQTLSTDITIQVN